MKRNIVSKNLGWSIAFLWAFLPCFQVLAQHVNNEILNPSFETGQSNKPDDWAQLKVECDDWGSFWSADWHTTLNHGANNHNSNRAIDDLSGATWHSGNVLLTPFSGDHMAGIGQCEGIYINLEEAGTDFGCEYTLKFMIHPRSFPDETNIWQSNVHWTDGIDVMFLSGEPIPSSSPCFESSFNHLVTSSYSFTFQRGMQAGVLIDEFTPHQWREIVISDIEINEDMKYLFVRLPQISVANGYGKNNKHYFYFDNFRLSSTETSEYAEEYIEIESTNDVDASFMKACDYIQFKGAYSSPNDPIQVSAPTANTFLAKNEIVIDYVTEVTATESSAVEFSLDKCMNCPSSDNIFNAPTKLCFCSNGHEFPASSIFPSSIDLIPPVPPQANNTIVWTSGTPDATVSFNASTGNTEAQFIDPILIPGGYKYFDFFYHEVDQNNNIVNTRVLRFFGSNECTASELSVVGAPSNCHDGNSSLERTLLSTQLQEAVSKYELALQNQEEKENSVKKEGKETKEYKDSEPDRASTSLMQINSKFLSREAYPNPTNAITHLNSTGNEEYMIYNGKGQLLQRGWLTEGNNPIDLSSYPPGLYQIQTELSTHTISLVR